VASDNKDKYGYDIRSTVSMY